MVAIAAIVPDTRHESEPEPVTERRPLAIHNVETPVCGVRVARLFDPYAEFQAMLEELSEC